MDNFQTRFRSNRFATASALVLFGLLPAWIDFWWAQRHWASKNLIVVGGPLVALLAVILGMIAWRRKEPAGGMALLAASVLPVAIAVWMNFVPA